MCLLYTPGGYNANLVLILISVQYNTKVSYSNTLTKFTKSFAYLLIIGGSVGLWAAFQLSLHKLELLNNPTFVPSCDINPVVACGSVIESAQGAAFGFPNPFLGLAGFAVVVTIGMGLLAGAKFQRWFWLGLQAGVTFGAIFVHWLIFQSLYSIGALCPYCMLVWTVTIPLFWYVTLYNLRVGNIAATKKVSEFLLRHHADILLLWFVIVLGLILKRFWFYWSTLI